MLWELLTFRLPFEDANAFLLGGQIMSGRRLDIPPPSELPGPEAGGWAGLGDYIALMQRCWSQEPGARPSFAEVAETLEGLSELH